MKARLRLFSSKALFISFLCSISTVSLTVWIVGRQFHRSIYQNTFETLGVLSIIFFLFLVYGLYFGFDIKSTVKDLRHLPGPPAHTGAIDFGFPGLPDLADGVEGLVLGIVVWIAMAVLTVVLLFLLEAIIWAGILIAVGSIHWIFYRAIRLLLKRSGTTGPKILASMRVGAYYSAL